MTERTVITTRGLQLLARLASGAEQLEFTGVKVGTGVVPDGTDPAQLMHLVSYKMDGMIADYGYDQETDDAFVVMQITNAGITSGFVMTEVGLFAMDPDRGEILYAYVDLSEDPNYIMPEENGRAKTVQIKMHVVVGEAANITATINPLSQVTMEAFQRELGKKTDSEGGDISDAVAGFETPGAEIKYPELEPGGSVKGILGGIRRWLETLKKEKVTADGGEAGETTATFEDYTGANPAPSVETALAGIRSKGKTGNILSNIKAALMGLVTLGEMRKYLVNNGLCTEPGKFFLDAAYGKTLMDEITRLNGEADSVKYRILTANAVGGDVLEFANKCGIGITFFYTLAIGTGYPTNNQNYKTAPGMILKRKSTGDIVVIIFNPLSNLFSTNSRAEGSDWSGWKER